MGRFNSIEGRKLTKQKQIKATEDFFWSGIKSGGTDGVKMIASNVKKNHQLLAERSHRCEGLRDFHSSKSL
ncbi:hypothetical protein ACEW7V_01980 [Areca yellow leaf disease phytoplasma]|uniref:hypothetical protein n=1 Tax=Areca yellow leaf disease phytoplasma TaxID=927614 RepID=UPI0035B5482D